MDNPTDQGGDQGGTPVTDPNAPVVDPNAGVPAQDAPMGGRTYTPPATPLGDQTTSEPAAPQGDTGVGVGTDTGEGENNPGGQPTGGAPVV